MTSLTTCVELVQICTSSVELPQRRSYATNVQYMHISQNQSCVFNFLQKLSRAVMSFQGTARQPQVRMKAARRLATLTAGPSRPLKKSAGWENAAGKPSKTVLFTHFLSKNCLFFCNIRVQSTGTFFLAEGAPTFSTAC